MRLATYAPALTRKGPGLLLADLQKGDDPQIAAVVEVIAAARPDVLLLTDFDWDFEGLALDAFAARLAAAGLDYPHRLAPQPNRGLATGLDLDGDGRRGTPEDAQGFGFFTGEGGMALLSNRPLGALIDHSAARWRDQPGT
ncbi:endonuclease/exonuclease/phosphatase family protein [Paracoccus sp. S-4012]|uniref:endonuclease/exonuclease/phosphatase family protein n=1 Tax=Paracoccus sp. S-4012 TaxID=2665648 RepID=UPI00351BA8C7